MRHSIIIMSFVFVSTQLFSQKVGSRQGKSSRPQAPYTYVSLNNKKSIGKIIAFFIGEKAIIFLEADSILRIASEGLSNTFMTAECKEVIHFVDSSSAKDDTTIITDPTSRFEYIVSDLLQKGNARVYYMKKKTLVDTISYRLERFGGNADRFFYLPDKRPFFSVLALIGIIDPSDNMSLKKRLQIHYQEYVEEGNKIASIRKY